MSGMQQSRNNKQFPSDSILLIIWLTYLTGFIALFAQFVFEVTLLGYSLCTVYVHLSMERACVSIRAEKTLEQRAGSKGLERMYLWLSDRVLGGLLLICIQIRLDTDIY